MSHLIDIYHNYITCLNRQDWPNLQQFVHADVQHNDRKFGLNGYRDMLVKNFAEIPDLHFNIELLVANADYVASRLIFNCTPKGSFLGLAVNGRRVVFAENAFYRFQDNKIGQVWSVIDKAAIEAQLE